MAKDKEAAQQTFLVSVPMVAEISARAGDEAGAKIEAGRKIRELLGNLPELATILRSEGDSTVFTLKNGTTAAPAPASASAPAPVKKKADPVPDPDDEDEDEEDPDDGDEDEDEAPAKPAAAKKPAGPVLKSFKMKVAPVVEDEDEEETEASDEEEEKPAKKSLGKFKFKSGK